MNQEWYTLKRVRRVKGVLSRPKTNGNFLERVCISFMFFLIEPVMIYEEGLEQINSKGETRVIWEKEE